MQGMHKLFTRPSVGILSIKSRIRKSGVLRVTYGSRSYQVHRDTNNVVNETSASLKLNSHQLVLQLMFRPVYKPTNQSYYVKELQKIENQAPKSIYEYDKRTSSALEISVLRKCTSPNPPILPNDFETDDPPIILDPPECSVTPEIQTCIRPAHISNSSPEPR